MNYCLSVFLLFLLAQPTRIDPEPEKLFKELPSIPEKRLVTSSLDINNQGGHLQGIQVYSFEGKDYLYFSGSSSTYGYLVVADGKEVRKLHILDHKPFKHAGGFQIDGNWLAVGIEDNDARTDSRVYVYKLENPLEDLSTPTAIIKRTGPRERATAGAVAIQQVGQALLLMVGDWGNQHMDIYRALLKNSSDPVAFEKTGEVDMLECIKTGWTDTLARAYQNINLMESDRKLYLVGFAGNGANEDIADVFKVDDPFGPAPKLTKVLSKSFTNDGTTRFSWGAGLLFNENGLSVYACGSNFRGETVVAVYR